MAGVVPEIASRRHVEAIIPVIDEALAQAGTDLAEIDAVAATHGPGLVGGLASWPFGGQGNIVRCRETADLCESH